MKQIIPHTEWQGNHLRNDPPDTFESLFTTTSGMQASNSRSTIWKSVLALMQKHYGAENLNRLAREAKIGPATASRLKAQETSIGIDTIDKLVDYFRVEPWQLMLPGFDPDKPQTLATASPMARDVAQMLDTVEDVVRQRRVYALIVQVIEFGAGQTEEKAPAPGDVPTPTPLSHK